MALVDNYRPPYLKLKRILMKNCYYVYKHVSPSNKVYIGITSISPFVRWRNDGSGYATNQHFWRAIQKYGWDNFKHYLLAWNVGEMTAKNMEKDFIKFYDSTNKDKGYNITLGGEGCYKDKNAGTKEYYQNYYIENKELYNTRRKQWYQDNKDYENERNNQYYQDHKEEVRAKQREYYRKNKEKILERQKQSRIKAIYG